MGVAGGELHRRTLTFLVDPDLVTTSAQPLVVAYSEAAFLASSTNSATENDSACTCVPAATLTAASAWTRIVDNEPRLRFSTPPVDPAHEQEFRDVRSRPQTAPERR